VVPAPARRRRARAPHPGDREDRQRAEAENARIRQLEARLEASRTEHFQAGDALNAPQGSLYSANAEVARHESELRHVEETRNRLESQHTERRTQLADWREQRAQLTQSLHTWAVRAGEARTRVAAAQAALEAENARLPQAEQAYRDAQEKVNEARSVLLQAESRSQIEQANQAHRLARRCSPSGANASRPNYGDGNAGCASLANSNPVSQDAAAVESAQPPRRLQAEAPRSVNAVTLGTPSASMRRARTLRQIQPTRETTPLREWLDRHGRGTLPRRQKLRIDAGWETAVEAVLRERLHAEMPDSGRLILSDRPPKASLFDKESSAAGGSPRRPPRHKGQGACGRPAVGGALADWLKAYIARATDPQHARCPRVPSW
jgi:chromosome segregation protein